ncbi:Serine/threonine-protein kinase [Marasmius tenuissimus]|uniref:non-specific serine/threonine protein kinase n=1 Tax=Marasmius tenuissimus TaxID=585030 RepID=A0ABR2ZK18_9AGAR
MGNVQSGSTLTRTTGALDSFISELGGDIVYERSLGTARFLKTVRCRHKNGLLVVKIFIKPDPGVTLRTHLRRLKVEREALSDIANVYNYQTFVETDKAGYIIRQWIASNLYDRISTRPFLSPIEKKWIAFQVITGLRDARNRKISHGDIKSENILVTSWNWVYLSDFATYKPVYLPLDDPSDFSFYFDTSGRRTCYIAPERFYTASGNPEITAKKSKIAMEENDGKRDGKITEAMDCFSVGCVIAELFLEGAPLFTLSQLFKYRDGDFNVDAPLNEIEDVGVRNVIKQMISLDPSQRPTFDSLLHTSRGTVFPECFFSFLHNYVSSVNELPTTPPFAGLATPVTPSTTITPTPNPRSSQPPTLHGGAVTSNETLPSDSDHRLERLWADFESVEPYITAEMVDEPTMGITIDYNSTASTSKPFQDVLPVELHIPNRESKLTGVLQPAPRAAIDGPALMILALVSANLRNCSLPSSKIRALDVFLALSPHLTDEAKLDRMVPYIVDLLHDDAAPVRMAAIRTLVQVLMMVTVITPSNAAIFPEYIIPNIKYLVQDPEVSVRCTYAQCLVQVADTAVRYLEMGQALKAHGSFKLLPDAQEYDAHYEASPSEACVSYDASMQDLQNNIQEHLSALLMDPSSIVKRAVLHDISYLCIFLRQRTNDVILSHMITYLNDRDWLLRLAFFESIVDVAACAGGRSLEEYILPLMIQALSDVEETVVAKVLTALTSLCELGLFQKMRIWELMSATLGFLYHPNAWIRQGAAAFIASAAKHLPASDVWCVLYPSLRHFLNSDIAVIDEQNVLVALKPPLPRQIFDGAVQWAQRADKLSFWRGSKRAGKGKESPRASVASFRRTGTSITRNMSADDEPHVAKLQQLGMTTNEEPKLQAMRDYILKLANALSSFASRSHLEPDTEKTLKVIGDVELPKVGVVPQTVFLKLNAADDGIRTSRSSRRSVESVRSPILSPSVHRISSDGTPSNAPFEDLRRRLATINGSASSLSVTQTPRPPSSPLAIPPSKTISAPLSPATTDRPGSPTESVVSTTNSTSFRPLSRMQVGSIDTQKAAPAVGSFKTNALGLLDSHPHMRIETSPEPSERSSPLSTSNTVRPSNLSRVPSLAPISSYDGQDPAISNLLENLYLDNNRELQGDFGPKVHEGPVRRRNPVRQSFVSRDGSAKKIETALIAHLGSHSEAITGLAVSPDHMFFVSASDDKTVKVWDTARLERNVTSKPRHTYGQHHARVKAICMLEGVHCFASAADDGSLHIVRVHITQGGTLPKYNKLQVIREHRVDTVGEYITCMTHYNTESASNLVYATTHSMITILDLRTMRVLQSMENPRHFGPVTSMCLDRKRSWILVGTSTGVLSLWDRRFGLLLKSWHVGVASTGRSVRIHQCVVHPSKGRGKWVMVTVEASKKVISRSSNILVEVWDIEKSILVETFVVRHAPATTSDAVVHEPHELAGVDADTSPSAAIDALVRSRQAGEELDKKSLNIPSQLMSLPSTDVRAVTVGMEFGGHSFSHRSDFADLSMDSTSSRSPWKGFMITGSEDRKLRLWDLHKVERSTVLCGLEEDNERPTYCSLTTDTASTHVETWPASGTSQSNRPQQRMSLITHTQQNLLKSHQDVITALVCIDSPFRCGIVSGDRAGVIKVWRVDAGGEQ